MIEGELTRVTDTKGNIVMDSVTDEPLPGSVVLTEGPHGTAWQRFFSDGKWHPVRGGGSKTWAELTQKRNLMLAYDAAKREG